MARYFVTHTIVRVGRCLSYCSCKDCNRFNSCQVIYSQFGLAIHENDHQTRRRFVEWAQNEIAVVPDFHNRILFSDEAHFWLNGFVNKQNCRIWSEANPQVYVETPLHAEKLTVWCTLWAARATIDLLKDTFGDRLISRFGPVNWPPRSCDLTPLDYFLWGYVKALVYADKPQTLDHLEDNIRRVIADIRPQMLEKVIENWTSRLDYIRASRGSPMPEIIVKMWIPIAAGNFHPRGRHLTSDDTNMYQDLILPRTSKPNRRSREILHAVLSYDMAAVEFLHHENPPTWTGVETPTMGAEGQPLTNHANTLI
ncbi:putative LOC100569746 [Trichonephila clavipes]|nr:putative LOC100569746 [Trichonephila clavipes]